MRDDPQPGERALSTPAEPRPGRIAPPRSAVTLLFAAALFLSAALIFCVQPMAAKALLPLYGGAPAVWTTCLVFFQAALLGGYLYAHAALRWIDPRRQAPLHVLLLIPLALLPVAVGEDAAGPALESRPITSLLWLLATSVGPPFLLLSASAPLLQRWYARLGRAHGRDPYFLYAASNLGSLLILAAYPLLIEPRLDLGQQRSLWRGGYLVLIALVAAAALYVRRAPAARADAEEADAAGPDPPAAARPMTWPRRLRWLLLAFVPSSLLLGVTTYVTTDLAAVPLFWVIPLALYLSSFVLVFAERALVPHATMARILPLSVTIAAMILLANIAEPGWLLAIAHLAMFFVACMVCHGELAADRPRASDLTGFYLCMSIGGALGGIFNGLIAPVVFPGVVEYPLAMALACACRPAPADQRNERGASLGVAEAESGAAWIDLAHPIAAGLLTVVLVYLAESAGVRDKQRFIVIYALPLLLNYTAVRRPIRFALGLGAILLASALHHGPLGAPIDSERNFFGVLRVTLDPTGRFHQIVHGRIRHGRQSLDPARRREPLGYYHPTGPVGDVFALAGPRAERVAVIGLGAGSMACYARPGQSWTFYEINPAVVRMALDPRLFTYLTDCIPDPSRREILLGDARLRLHDAPAGAFDLLAIDAFSSDAIPVHLLTREALALYLDRLSPRGILLLHISNLYLDLRPVVAALAADAGLAGRLRDDRVIPAALEEAGRDPSRWVALARSAADLEGLPASWVPLKPRPGVRPWTDSFSDVVGALRPSGL